jgi:hypothetical protein
MIRRKTLKYAPVLNTGVYVLLWDTECTVLCYGRRYNLASELPLFIFRRLLSCFNMCVPRHSLLLLLLPPPPPPPVVSNTNEVIRNPVLIAHSLCPRFKWTYKNDCDNSTSSRSLTKWGGAQQSITSYCYNRAADSALIKTNAIVVRVSESPVFQYV